MLHFTSRLRPKMSRAGQEKKSKVHEKGLCEAINLQSNSATKECFID